MGERLRPWEEFPELWKSESAFMSYIRGGIRGALWKNNPIKLEFIKRERKRIQNPVASRRGRFPEIWGATCYVCQQDFAIKDIEVDHIKGGHSLKTMDDLQTFVEGIVCVGKGSLGLICTTCHKAKSYAEKHSMSQEDAVIEKRAIEICSAPAVTVRGWLEAIGIVAETTAAKRRLQVVQALKEGKAV